MSPSPRSRPIVKAATAAAHTRASHATTRQPPRPAPPPTPTPGGAIPTGLPTHFAIGVSAQPPDLAPSGWETQSGVPFDYAYQYLAAGVNTGNGLADVEHERAVPALVRT